MEETSRWPMGTLLLRRLEWLPQRCIEKSMEGGMIRTPCIIWSSIVIQRMTRQWHVGL